MANVLEKQGKLDEAAVTFRESARIYAICYCEDHE